MTIYAELFSIDFKVQFFFKFSIYKLQEILLLYKVWLKSIHFIVKIFGKNKSVVDL